MSADNAIFVVKTGTAQKPTFSVFADSASWFQELWLDVDSLRDPEPRFYDAPEPTRLAELLDESEQFTDESEALSCAARLSAEVGYVEYGVQFVDVTGEHTPWDKNIADQSLRDANLEGLVDAVVEAAKAAEPGSSFTFSGEGYKDHALLVCASHVNCELYYSNASCTWVPGDKSNPASYLVAVDKSED